MSRDPRLLGDILANMQSQTVRGPIPYNGQINSPEDWLKHIRDHWDNLMVCFSNAHLAMSRDDVGRTYSDDLRNKPYKHDLPLIETLEQLRDSGNLESCRKLCDWLNNVWIRAPDSIVIHSWPSWNVLCDLCSEEEVLYPEMNDNA
jgi:hypothetical protein